MSSSVARFEVDCYMAYAVAEKQGVFEVWSVCFSAVDLTLFTYHRLHSIEDGDRRSSVDGGSRWMFLEAAGNCMA